MSAQHTPGPWKVRKHWSDDGAYEVYPTRGGKPKFGEWSAIAEVTDAVSKGESAKANARLIAAAPDLLEALKLAKAEIWRLLDVKGVEPIAARKWPEILAAEAAIAKATGGAA